MVFILDKAWSYRIVTAASREKLFFVIALCSAFQGFDHEHEHDYEHENKDEL
jgi:hypothetical protein